MKTHKLFQITIYVAILICLFSCENYYKISKSQTTSTIDVVIKNNPQRYFILRNGDAAYHMNNIVLNEDEKSLTCTLDPLPPEHALHLTNGIDGHMRYKKKSADAVVLNEVHVYAPSDSSLTTGNNYLLTFNKVQKIEVLVKDKGKTTTCHVLGYIGLAWLTLAVVGATAITIAGGPL